MDKIQSIVRGCLFKAKTPKDNEIHFMAYDMQNGYIVKIWYRAQGDENKLVRQEVVTSEAYDWERAGCSDAEEYRAYLNRKVFENYQAGL